MELNILLDRIPETVEIGGAEHRINYDFRTSMLFEIMMGDSSLSNEEKAMNALYLYYGEITEDPDEAIGKLLWFYRCGEEKRQKKQKRFDEKTGKFVEVEDDPVDPVYSFEHDAPYIYAAFLQQYGIDLTVEDMHWWKFKALFRSLSEDTKFVQIVGYRSIDISSKMSSEQRNFYARMKDLYALPLPEGEQARQDAILEALMGDGNVSGLL